MYKIEAEGEDVSIVIYSQEFATDELGITEEDVKKYGLPRGIKYNNCNIIIPIPTSRIVKKMAKKMSNNELTDEQISEKLAKDFFK